MKLSIIVAISENHVIGRDGGLPWHLSADLKNFKRLTMGHPIIMGRKTYDSIGRPLPGRTSIVITRQDTYQPDGVETVGTIADALKHAKPSDEAFVIGGAEIYRLSLPLADRLHITRVHATVEGDVVFPDLDPEEWQLQNAESHDADERNDFAFTFETYERSTAAARSK
jgi:dihydrofolate reductase